MRDVIKTVKCRMEVTDADRLALKETFSSFAAACNTALAYAKETGRTRRFALQHDVYRTLREKHGLMANYACRATDRVAADFTAKRTVRAYRPTSITIDRQLFRYIPATESISIATTRGRLHIAFKLGDYQRRLLSLLTPGVGTISIDGKGNFYANLRIKIETPAPSGSTALGVDLGISRIATTSDGLILSGKSINRKREHRARIKASIQSKGTKGSKRLLKRLAWRDARYMKDVNHCISRKLVDQAKAQDRFIALEDLTGIRERTAKQGRHHRRRMGRWAFFQLRQFIQYKAEEKGVRVVMINPRYTSQTCPTCRELGSRIKHRFSCGSCGYTGDADIVGALNIAVAGDAVKRPEVA